MVHGRGFHVDVSAPRKRWDTDERVSRGGLVGRGGEGDEEDVMMAREIDQMFQFKFEKTHEEIIEKAEAKVKEMNAKIEERQRRIVTLREEYGIDSEALVQLLTAARRQTHHAATFSYLSNASVGTSRMEERTIGAGVVNHLLTENDHVEAEKANVKQLGFVIRNLRPLKRYDDEGNEYYVDGHALSYDEMEFLGF